MPMYWIRLLIVQGVTLGLGFIGFFLLSQPSPLAQSRTSQTKDRKVSIARPVQASERRVALVIGNGNYPFGSLRNPVNDATDMAQTLTNLGFEVTSRTDVTQREMLALISDFGKQLQSGDVGLFYFAGHGVQVSGENYLIPVDAGIKTDTDVDVYCVELNKVLKQMQTAGNRFNIVILDACRNNPFLTRSWRNTQPGLAEVKANSGMYIAFATSPGATASDGTGRNGLYTQALLQALNQPGIPIEQTFKTVFREVKQKSNGQQLPYLLPLFDGDFYFLPEPPTPEPEPEKPAVAIPSAAAIEEEAWNDIKDSTRPEDFKAFLSEYPNGNRAKQARIKLAKLTMTRESAIPPGTTPERKKSASEQPASPSISKPNTTAPPLSSKVGSLVLTTNTVDAVFSLSNIRTKTQGQSGAFINSRQLTQTLSLLPGQYQVTVQHPGFEPFTRKVEIVAGHEVSLNAELHRRAEPPPTKETASDPPPVIAKNPPATKPSGSRKPAKSTPGKNSKTTQLLVDRGFHKLTAGDFDGAIQDLFQARELAPDQKIRLDEALAEAYFQRGLSKKAGQNFAGAIEDVKSSIELNPNQSPVYAVLGGLLAQEGNLEAAVASGQQACELDPQNPHYQRELLVWLCQLGDQQKANQHYEKAEQTYVTALKFSPRDAAMYNSLGKCQAELGKNSEAEAHLREAVRLQPASAVYLKNLGIHLVNQKKPGEAIPFLKEYVRLEQRDGVVYFLLGCAYTQTEELLLAEETFKKAIDLNNNVAEWHFALGLALEKQSKTSLALFEFSKASELSPENPTYLEARNRLVPHEKPTHWKALDVQVLNIGWDSLESNVFRCEVQINRPARTKVEAKVYAVKTANLGKNTEIASTKVVLKTDNEKKTLLFRLQRTVLISKQAHYQVIVYLNDEPTTITTATQNEDGKFTLKTVPFLD